MLMNQGETRFRLYEKRQWKFCGGVIQICGTTLFCFSMNNPEIGQVWTCHLYQGNHIKRIISREDFEIFCLKQYLVLWKPNCWHIWQLCCWITIPLGGKEEETTFLQIKLNLITLKTFFRGFYHKQLNNTIAFKIAKQMDTGYVVSDLLFIYFMLSFKLPKQSWFDL